MDKDIIIENTEIKEAEKIKSILIEKGYENIFAWTDPPHANYSSHIHNDDEMRWVYHGSIIIGHKDGEVELFPGDKISITAGVKHWAKSDKGVSYICGSKYSGK